MEEIKSINDILNKYSVFIFDQWGVLHDGNKIYDGVENLILSISEKNKEIFILSNFYNPSWISLEIKDNLLIFTK